MPLPDTSAPDGADMARLCSGHDAALNDLMERHGAPVFSFLYRMLNNEEDANDLAQETFVRIYRSRDSYRPGAKFTTWLFTIAANLARNQLRWRHRHPNISIDAESLESGSSVGDVLPAEGPLPDAQLTEHERAAAVRQAVEHLPEDMREAIVLCELEDQSIATAAEILETTPKAVEARLYRARQLLRQRLAKWL